MSINSLEWTRIYLKTHCMPSFIVSKHTTGVDPTDVEAWRNKPRLIMNLDGFVVYFTDDFFSALKAANAPPPVPIFPQSEAELRSAFNDFEAARQDTPTKRSAPSIQRFSVRKSFLRLQSDMSDYERHIFTIFVGSQPEIQNQTLGYVASSFEFNAICNRWKLFLNWIRRYQAAKLKRLAPKVAKPRKVNNARPRLPKGMLWGQYATFQQAMALPSFRYPKSWPKDVLEYAIISTACAMKNRMLIHNGIQYFHYDVYHRPTYLTSETLNLLREIAAGQSYVFATAEALVKSWYVTQRMTHTSYSRVLLKLTLSEKTHQNIIAAFVEWSGRMQRWHDYDSVGALCLIGGKVCKRSPERIVALSWAMGSTVHEVELFVHKGDVCLRYKDKFTSCHDIKRVGEILSYIAGSQGQHAVAYTATRITEARSIETAHHSTLDDLIEWLRPMPNLFPAEAVS